MPFSALCPSIERMYANLIIVLYLFTMEYRIIASSEPYKVAGIMYACTETKDVNVQSILKNGYCVKQSRDEVELDYGIDDYYVKSWGFEDPGFVSKGSKVTVNGKDLRPRERGFSLMEFKEGKVISARAYDTVANISLANEMASDIVNIQNGTLVIVCIDDAASVSAALKSELRSIGGKDVDLGFRNAYCLINEKGSTTKKWLDEKAAKMGKGPIVCRIMAPWNRYGYFQDT